MIDEKRVRRYCNEDISKIENYDKAISDKSQTWQCHHRAEILPCGRFSQDDLKANGLFYGQPADRLIFLERATHRRIHMSGRPISESFRKKIGELQKGNKNNLGTRWGESSRRRMSESRSGYVWWNNGITTRQCRDCPGEGWVRGRL